MADGSTLVVGIVRQQYNARMATSRFAQCLQLEQKQIFAQLLQDGRATACSFAVAFPWYKYPQGPGTGILGYKPEFESATLGSH